MAIRVLVIDDSALMRKVITDILGADSEIEVVGIAQNGSIGLRKIGELNPDIVTLDVDMPIMDGLATLKKIMSDFPRPVIMLSGLTQAGAGLTLECLNAGAVDYIFKPGGRSTADLRHIAADIKFKVKTIYRENSGNRLSRVIQSPRPLAQTSAPVPESIALTDKVVVIGISTGGPNSLSRIFPQIPALFPPVVVVQHMPPEFTGSFARRLNAVSAIQVSEAGEGDILKPGCGFVAPGDRHVAIKKSGPQFRLTLNSAEKVDGHRPSATVLFSSAAKSHGKNTIALIMTGMGRDGVDGLKDIRAAGGQVIGQDQETCVVYGMPGVAARENTVDFQAPLEKIIPRAIEILNRKN